MCVHRQWYEHHYQTHPWFCCWSGVPHTKLPKMTQTPLKHLFDMKFDCFCFGTMFSLQEYFVYWRFAKSYFPQWMEPKKISRSFYPFSSEYLILRNGLWLEKAKSPCSNTPAQRRQRCRHPKQQKKKTKKKRCLLAWLLSSCRKATHEVTVKTSFTFQIQWTRNAIEVSNRDMYMSVYLKFSLAFPRPLSGRASETGRLNPVCSDARTGRTTNLFCSLCLGLMDV